MRKRNLMCLFDTLFWYIIYALPFLSWLLYLWGDNPQNIIMFPEWVSQDGFGWAGPVYDYLLPIFGDAGIFPIASEYLLYILSWFVSCAIIHLAVDVLLFIPRLSHNWLEKFTSGRD